MSNSTWLNLHLSLTCLLSQCERIKVSSISIFRPNGHLHSMLEPALICSLIIAKKLDITCSQLGPLQIVQPTHSLSVAPQKRSLGEPLRRECISARSCSYTQRPKLPATPQYFALLSCETQLLSLQWRPAQNQSRPESNLLALPMCHPVRAVPVQLILPAGSGCLASGVKAAQPGCDHRLGCDVSWATWPASRPSTSASAASLATGTLLNVPSSTC